MRTIGLPQLTSSVLLTLFALPASADPSFLPLGSGNYWELTNSYSGARYRIAMEDTQTLGTKVMTRFRITTTAWELALLASPNGDALEGEGVDYTPSAKMYFDRAMPLFSGTAAVGTSWQSPLGRVTLLSKTAKVTTPKGTFSNCLQFRMEIGASILDWYFAPGLGVVRMGTDAYSFLLTNYQAVTYTRPAGKSQTGACPPTGVAPNPAANGDHSTTGQLSRLLMARDAGARFLNVSATWQELEPSPGTYDFAEVRRYMGWAKTYGLKVVLTIKTLDNTALSIPSDLAALPLDNALVMSRFKTMLAALAPSINTAVTHINLANETNTYLDAHPQQVSQFVTFLLDGAGQLKAAGIRAPIGVTFAFSDFRRNDAMVRVLVPYCEQVSFTYYPLRPDWTLRSTSDVSWDFAEMVKAAAGKPVVLTEVGTPTHSYFGGGTSGQSSFYAAVMDELKLNPVRIQGAAFFLMSDPPTSVVEHLTADYSQGGTPVFGYFLGSLGLFDVNNRAKPAWSTFSTKAKQIAAAASCTSRAIY